MPNECADRSEHADVASDLRLVIVIEKWHKIWTYSALFNNILNKTVIPSYGISFNIFNIAESIKSGAPSLIFVHHYFKDHSGALSFA